MPIRTANSRARLGLFAVVAAHLATVGLLLLVATVSRLKDIPVPHFTRDVAASAGVPFYNGSVSSLGLLLWSAAAAIGLFAWACTRGRPHLAAEGRLLGQGGLLTVALVTDDAFLLHENAPRLLGVPSEVVLLGLGLAAAAVLYRNGKVIRRTPHPLLALAFAFFGVSVGLDLAQDLGVAEIGGVDFTYLIEDGSKLLGIVAWLSYWAWTALDLVAPLAEDTPQAPEAVGGG